jgi:hypothetical protein
MYTRGEANKIAVVRKDCRLHTHTARYFELETSELYGREIISLASFRDEFTYIRDVSFGEIAACVFVPLRQTSKKGNYVTIN